MGKPIIAALEVGTSKTALLIAEPLAGGRVRVIGRGVAQTAGGVRKGLLVDMRQARAAVDTARRQAEKEADVTVGEVLLSLSGGHIQTRPGEGRTPVRDGDGKVTRDDMDEVQELSRSSGLGAERTVLHAVSQTYSLDDLAGIANPEGMRGKQLKLDTLFIHGQRNRVEDIINLLKGLAMETRVVAFSPLAAASAVLTAEQRNHGVLLVDLGGGTTSYIVFARNVAVAAGALGVGVDHVTSDIAMAFNAPWPKAEEMKLTEGSAVIDPQRSGRRLELAAGMGHGAARSISVKALHTVIEARMRETLALVREQLVEGHHLRQVGAGVVFTGGGAYLPGLDVLAESVLGLRAQIGEPLAQCVEGVQHDRVRPAALAPAAGLLLDGAEAYAAESLFGPMKSWLRRVAGGGRP